MPIDGLTYYDGRILNNGEVEIRNKTEVCPYFLLEQSDDIVLLVFDAPPFFRDFLRDDGSPSFDGAALEALGFPPAPLGLAPSLDGWDGNFFLDDWAPPFRWAPLAFFELGDLSLWDCLLRAAWDCCAFFLDAFLPASTSLTCRSTSSMIITRTVFGSTVPSAWMASATWSAFFFIIWFFATFLMRRVVSFACTCLSYTV